MTERTIDLEDMRREGREASSLACGSYCIRAADEIERLTNALEYLLGDRSNVHPMFGGRPNVGDFAYTAFMRALSKNDEDGGPTDWFNDTWPLIEAGVRKWRDDLKLPVKKAAPANDRTS